MFRSNAERLCEYLRTERPVLLVGFAEVQGIRGFAVHESTRPEVLQDTLKPD